MRLIRAKQAPCPCPLPWVTPARRYAYCVEGSPARPQFARPDNDVGRPPRPLRRTYPYRERLPYVVVAPFLCAGLPISTGDLSPLSMASASAQLRSPSLCRARGRLRSFFLEIIAGARCSPRSRLRIFSRSSGDIVAICFKVGHALACHRCRAAGGQPKAYTTHPAHRDSQSLRTLGLTHPSVAQSRSRSLQGPVSRARFRLKVRPVVHRDPDRMKASGLASLGSKLRRYWRCTSSLTI